MSASDNPKFKAAVDALTHLGEHEMFDALQQRMDRQVAMLDAVRRRFDKRGGDATIGIAKLGERYLDDDEAAALARAADDAIQMIEQERYTCGNDLCHWSDKMWERYHRAVDKLAETGECC